MNRKIVFLLHEKSFVLLAINARSESEKLKTKEGFRFDEKWRREREPKKIVKRNEIINFSPLISPLEILIARCVPKLRIFLASSLSSHP